MRRIGGVMAMASIAAACAGASDGGEPAASATPTVAAPTTAAPTDEFSASAQVDVSEPEYVDGPLVDVCPSTIVVQTAGLPGVPVGPLHRLLGDTADVAALGVVVSGPLTRVDGTVEDVRLEIRSGGPAVGFRDPVSLLADDDTILLAQTSTASAARRFDDVATTAVVTLTEASHRALVWDPATYPDLENFDDVRDAGIEIRHVTDDPLVDFLVAQGALDADQVVPGFDGEPAAFVSAAGEIAQIGDLLIDPALFESLPQWGRPVATLSPDDAGWVSHDDALVASAAVAEQLSTCLGRLVPIIQAAVVEYANDPVSTNGAMAAVRAQANPLTRISTELMDQAVEVGREAGVFANGTNSTVGDFDSARIDPFLEQLGASPDLYTNEFIDESIGF